MAAIAYPVGTRAAEYGRRPAAARRAHLYVVADPDAGRRPVGTRAPARVAPPVQLRPARAVRAAPRRYWRGVATAAATLAVLGGLWFASGALTRAHGTHLAVLPGSTQVTGGWRYTVRPGDTLWSIATRLDPTGDPRPLVDALGAQLAGAPLVAGSTLVVP